MPVSLLHASPESAVAKLKPKNRTSMVYVGKKI